jgi:hypothetical protein
MTLFGKVLIGLMLATAAVLIIKGGKGKDDIIVEEVPSENASSTPVAPDNDTFNGSITDLAKRGGDYECTFVQTNDMSDSTGTVFISGKKMRGDFKTTVKAVSGMNVESHMISDGEFMYNWSSMLPTGFKIAITESTNATSTPSGSQNFDYNQKLDYKCKAWMADSTKFELPASIKFTEIKK